mgnify:FL=1
MAASESSPSVPSLAAPSDAASVNGDEVTFVWKPAEDVLQYRLQVAPTAGFQDLLLDVSVGEETAVTVGNQLPTDGQTLFWRVVVERETGPRTTSAVESFVATTAEQAEADGLDAGPPSVAEVGQAAPPPETSPEAFDFEAQFEEEKDRGVAYEGVAATQIIGISGAILLVILVAVAILFGWFAQVTQDERTAVAERQTYDQIQQAEQEAARTLQEYGVLDEEEGVYRIPIQRAMDLVAKEQQDASSPPQ